MEPTSARYTIVCNGITFWSAAVGTSAGQRGGAPCSGHERRHRSVSKRDDEAGVLGVLEDIVLAQELDGGAGRLRLAVLAEDVGLDEVVRLRQSWWAKIATPPTGSVYYAAAARARVVTQQRRRTVADGGGPRRVSHGDASRDRV